MENLGGFAKRFIKDENTPEVKQPDMSKVPKVARATVAAALLAASAAPTDAAAKEPTQRELRIKQQDEAARQSLMRDLSEAVQTEHTAHEGEITAYDIECATRNIFHEARGEIDKGQLAVALVTLARVKDKRFANSVCGVVYERPQFSWTLEHRFLEQKPYTTESYKKIKALLNTYLLGKKYQEAIELLSFVVGLPRETLFYKVEGYAGSPATQAFFSRLQSVGTVGRHEFFIVPKKN